MMVKSTITVGFHSNFGAFKRNRHSKTVTRLAITNEFPFNLTTYESQNSVTNLAPMRVQAIWNSRRHQACFLALYRRWGR